MKTSEACIAFIKSMEGFAKYPVWDYAQYSVGYGCRCNKGDYPNGITEAEADALLRTFLSQFESGINGIGQKYTQNQFDALVSFSFNVGLGWTQNKSYRIYQLAHGTRFSDAEVIDIFKAWNKAGGAVLAGLTRRREAEARMWLYGENSEKPNTPKDDGVTEGELREKVVNIMRGWLGCKQGDKVHHSIIDTYNSIRPLPMGYRLSYSEAWCAAAVSAAGYLAGMQEIIFPHMNCGSLVALFKKAGRWVEDDAYVPKPGDLPIYDWSDNGVGDCTAHASHVGMVEWCDGKQFAVIEGNMGSGHVCGRRIMNVNGKYIRGFCCPNYESLATAEEETMYHTLKDIPAYYRKEVDELIANGALNGKGGEGEDLILDYNEGDIRTMVVMHRDIQKMLKGITAQTVDTTAIAKEVAKKIGEMLVQETVK
ncbi:MAG: lysozyme [Faecousia sp.]